jgi:hypothetical protein
MHLRPRMGDPEVTERQKWTLVGRGPSVDGRDWYLWQHQPNEYVPWAFDLWAIPVDEFWVGNEHLVHLLTDAANRAARDLRGLLGVPTEPDWFTPDDIRTMPMWDNPHLVRRPRLSGRATTGLRRPTRPTHGYTVAALMEMRDLQWVNR